MARQTIIKNLTLTPYELAPLITKLWANTEGGLVINEGELALDINETREKLKQYFNVTEVTDEEIISAYRDIFSYQFGGRNAELFKFELDSTSQPGEFRVRVKVIVIAKEIQRPGNV